jgi:hypothetical protein
MASGSGLATALAAVKAHAVAATIIGAVIVGGGAATAAVATGTVQVPGISHNTGSDTGSNNDTTGRTTACANNGDASRLAAIYAPMFSSKADAQTAICDLFAGTFRDASGHTYGPYGLGQVQLILETTAAVESNGNACLTASTAHGQPTVTGKPADPGHSGSAGTPAAGQSNQSNSAVPSTKNTSTTEGFMGDVIAADAHGTPLAQLAHDCGAVTATGNPDAGSNATETPDNQSSSHEPTHTPGAEPTGTPHGKP